MVEKLTLDEETEDGREALLRRLAVTEKTFEDWQGRIVRTGGQDSIGHHKRHGNKEHIPRHVNDGTRAPVATDDSDAGFGVGSRWQDTTNDEDYVLLDATVGAAVWVVTTGATILYEIFIPFGNTINDNGTTIFPGT